MNKFRFTIKLVAIAIFTLAFASMAQAQTRTWVSGVGDDLNPCSRTAPCKTFAGAISKTSANGEIDALDPGGFGTVTVTKSITIDGTWGAGFGSILASGTSGVIVNDSATATPGTIIVTLRRLSIDGAATTAGSGVRFTYGKTLNVEDCQIFGFTGSGTAGRGISVELGATDKNLFVSNTSIFNCTTGIRVGTTVGFVVATIDNVKIEQPTATVGSGIELAAGGNAHIRGSLISRMGTGVNITGAGAGFDVIGSTIVSCTTGLVVGASTSRVSSSSIVQNVTGITLAGGAIRSGCDNFIDGNTTEITGGVISNSCVH